MSRILPILFNTEMVQAILEDRKTATRRLIKSPYYIDDEKMSRRSGYAMHKGINITYGMPYPDNPYKICDILYVRETWAFQCCIDCMNIYEDDTCMIGKTSTIHEDKDASSEGCYIYRADHPHPERIIWRPSIHMPKAAARIWLKVTDVRVERLQDITPEESVREGTKEIFPPLALDEFREIWESTIRKPDTAQYGWPANPWVWVIEFERCEKPEVQDV